MNIGWPPAEAGEFHGVELTHFNQDVINWLRNIGPEGDAWFLRSNWIYFRDQSDHTMFLLRWQ